MHTVFSVSEMLAEEGPDALPAILGRRDPIAGTVDGEKGMTGALVAMELVRLPRILERGLQLVHLLGSRILSLVAGS